VVRVVVAASQHHLGAVTRATHWRRASRYAELADLLPGLIRELTAVAMASTGHQQEQAYGLLALAYRAADAIADKHGYRDMSARAVELTRWACRPTRLRLEATSRAPRRATLPLPHRGGPRIPLGR
jgi:hypothetical protein